MAEIPNVNNLNGIPNFGHGFPEEIISNEEQHEEETQENVADAGSEEEEVNG